MVRAFIPRLVIYPFIMIFVINLVAIYSLSPIHDPQYGALAKLLQLQWDDPVSGNRLNLPIDRRASLAQQIIELQNLKELYLQSMEVSALSPEIGYLTNLQQLHLTYTPISELPLEIEALLDLLIRR